MDNKTTYSVVRYFDDHPVETWMRDIATLDEARGHSDRITEKSAEGLPYSSWYVFDSEGVKKT